MTSGSTGPPVILLRSTRSVLHLPPMTKKQLLILVALVLAGLILNDAMR